MRRAPSISTPLRWPDGWLKTKVRDDGARKFSTGNGPVSFSVACEKLMTELRLMSARDVVISCDTADRDIDHRRLDPGVAVYFTFKGRQLVMASDRFHSPADNLRSIGCAIEAMRKLERHGGGAVMDRAFTGFVALPSPRSCWEILGVTKGAPDSEINRAYRELAKEAHPDNGGSN